MPDKTPPSTTPSPRLRRVAAVVAAIALVASGALVATPALSSLRGDVDISVRKDVKDLTSAEKAEIVAAILAAKATPSPFNPSISYYDQFVAWHRQAFKCSLGWNQGGNWAGAAHNSPIFLPWHREFLLQFEHMLRTVSGDPTLAVPYWDWTDPESTAAVFADDFMGGNGDPSQSYAVTTGPFRKGAWKLTIQDPAALTKGSVQPKSYLVRNFGAFPAGSVDLPTQEQVLETIGVHRYDHKPYNAQSPIDQSMRNTLEGWRDAKVASCDSGWIDQSQEPGSAHVMHNVVHLWVGGVWEEGGKDAEGTMAYNTSPNDPVFFFHHANVDRVWAAWEVTTGGRYRPQSGAPEGFNGNNTMWPWYNRTINSLFGTERNGYRYASLPGVS